MFRKLLFFLLLLFVVNAQLKAQENSSSGRNCRKINGVKDSDRRSFDDRDSFQIDVDGDGKPDTFTPRTYAVKVNRKASGKARLKPREVHWIAFDLKTSKGRTINSFFKYNYGTDEADYWVYAFVPCKVNRDARTDLLFYSGDDTSEEIIILENRGSAFKVYSRKEKALDE
jgi:hypothetical protein